MQAARKDQALASQQEGRFEENLRTIILAESKVKPSSSGASLPIAVGLAVGMGFVVLFALFVPSYTSIEHTNTIKVQLLTAASQTALARAFLMQYPNSLVAFDNGTNSGGPSVIFARSVPGTNHNSTAQTLTLSIPIDQTTVEVDTIRATLKCTSVTLSHNGTISTVYGIWPPSSRDSRSILDYIRETNCVNNPGALGL